MVSYFITNLPVPIFTSQNMNLIRPATPEIKYVQKFNWIDGHGVYVLLMSVGLTWDWYMDLLQGLLESPLWRKVRVQAIGWPKDNWIASCIQNCPSASVDATSSWPQNETDDSFPPSLPPFLPSLSHPPRAPSSLLCLIVRLRFEALIDFYPLLLFLLFPNERKPKGCNLGW